MSAPREKAELALVVILDAGARSGGVLRTRLKERNADD
jgi:hypothetical protein